MQIIRRNNFYEFDKLVKIMFTIPLTSVENERVFSKINKIQNKFTNRISPKNLYFRTLIYAKKIPIECFDFDRSLRLFFDGKKRNGQFRKALREIET